MHQSRIIRVSLLTLLVGVGLWGVLRLPVVLSQEGPKPASENPFKFDAAPPAVGASLPPVAPAGGQAGPAAPGAPGGLPDGTFTLTYDGLAEGGGAAGPGALSAGGGQAATAPPGGAAGPSPSGAPGGYLEVRSGGAGGGMSSMMGMMGGGAPLTQSQIEEMKLAQYAKALLTRYGKESKAENKEKIKNELRAVLHRQFRLQHQRRDAELTKIERRLADLRAKLKKRAEAQSTIVDRRLEQLVSDLDGLGWNAEDVPNNLFSESSGGSSMMMRGMPGMSIGGGGIGHVDDPVISDEPNDSSTAPPIDAGELPQTPNAFGAPPKDLEAVPPTDSAAPTVPARP